MGWWSRLELTAGQRPQLKSNETELLVQSHVGLYEGKLKAPSFQDGRVYLTSSRICYIDSKNPSLQSLELALADVDNIEYYGGFMRSSSKITIHMKSSDNEANRVQNDDKTKSKKSAEVTKGQDQFGGVATATFAEIHKHQQQTARDRRRRKLPFNEVTWICPICFFSNELLKDFEWPSGLDNFPRDIQNLADPDSTEDMPTCDTCGIKASKSTIYKAIEQVLGPSISAEVESPMPSQPPSSVQSQLQSQSPMKETGSTDLMMMIDNDINAYKSNTLIPISNSPIGEDDTNSLDEINPAEITNEDENTNGFACPRCTFINHPSLNFCEICGARLISPHLPPQLNRVMVQDGETLRSVSTFGTSSKMSLSTLKKLKNGEKQNSSATSLSSDPLGSGERESGSSTPKNGLNNKNAKYTLLYDDDGYILSLMGVSGPSNTFSDAAKVAHMNSLNQPSQISYKLSFRAGGDKQFYEALKEALQKIKQTSKSNPNKSSNSSNYTKNFTNGSGNNSTENPDASKTLALGIHGLQLSDESKREHNRLVLGAGIEGLAELMTRAKELVKLSEDYAKYLAQSDTSSMSSSASQHARQSLMYSTQALGLSSTVVTKDLVASDNSKLYYGELARQLAEFLTDNKQWHASTNDIYDSSSHNPGNSGSSSHSRPSSSPGMTYTSVLDREGGIITLFDLYAVYNRARGVSLVSPKDLYNACCVMEKLRLPIMLRKFRSGLLAVQESYKTPEVISRNLLKWMRSRGEEYRKKKVEELRVDMFSKGYDVDSLGSLNQGETATTRHKSNKSVFESSKEAQELLATIEPYNGTGVTSLDVSAKFKWSVMIATEELEVFEERGDLCRDEQVSGTVFYENLILTAASGWDWKKEVFGET